MTYGESAGEIREATVSLLRWRRIQQRLGGAGSHTIPVTTTVEERQRMGEIILRYRLAALTWCLEAVSATMPQGTSPEFGRTPVEELHYRLRQDVAAAGPLEQLSQLLAVRHNNHLLDAWQRLGRAAVVGERDFGSGVNRAALTSEQANAVLGDAAGITRGLVVLDARYSRVPGWTNFTHPTKLDRAAEAVSLLAAVAPVDRTVDHQGWCTPSGRIEGPALPGVAGVVQAEHNLLVELGRFPNALNLRRILVSQAQVANGASQQAAVAAPHLVERFAERARVYRDLVAASRNLGGLVGGGAQAAVESHNAAARLQELTLGSPRAREALEDLARIMTGTDVRIAATIERGFAENLYFVSVRIPRLDDRQVHGVFPVRHRWVPVRNEIQTDLLPLVRNELRSTSTPPPPAPPSRHPAAPPSARSPWPAAASTRSRRISP